MTALKISSEQTPLLAPSARPGPPPRANTYTAAIVSLLALAAVGACYLAVTGAPPVLSRLPLEGEGTCGAVGQCRARETVTHYKDGDLDEYEYVSDCSAGGLGCVGEVKSCRKCHVSAGDHPLGYPRCPMCVCQAGNLAADGCQMEPSPPPIPSSPPPNPPPPSPPSPPPPSPSPPPPSPPSPPPPKPVLTDSNFNKAITACLGTNPVNGMCVSEYGAMPDWDVSRVTNMARAFQNKHEFNADISRWDTSNVKDISYMFFNGNAFTADITGWKTPVVTSSDWMFHNAHAWAKIFKLQKGASSYATMSAFGPPSKWTKKPPALTDNTFKAAITACRQTNPVDGLCNDYEQGPMPDWDVSRVTDMSSAFMGQYPVTINTFNGDISRWDVSKVTKMTGMFYYSNFVFDITGWKTPANVVANQMFYFGWWHTKFKINGPTTQASATKTMYGAGPPNIWTPK